MSPAQRHALCDLVLPGTGLLLADHLVTGSLVLLATLAAGAALLMGAALATPVFWAMLWPITGGTWLAALLIAELLHLAWDRERPSLHPEMSRSYRDCVRAWFADDRTTATRHARALVRLVPGNPGAWELLRLLAAEDGHRGEERRARRAHARLIARQAVVRGR